MNDLKFAIRQLLKNPGFTAVVVLTLALGIGANTAIFSVVDRLLVRPLPVRDPQQLALLAQPMRSGSLDYDFNYPLFLDFQREATAFDALSVVTGQSVAVQSDGATDRRRALLVSDNYFSMLGVSPALGRFFHPGEAAGFDSAPLAVLSHQLWMTGFGGDPAAVGKVVSINRHPYTIIGVASREFAGTELGPAPELYLPITMSGQLSGHSSAEDNPLQSRRHIAYRIMGRLKPGVRHDQAQAALRALATRVAAETPQNTPADPVVVPGAQGFTDSTSNARLPIKILFAVASLILLLICANLANLQMARSSGRAREFAIRLALGAQRWRLIRQFLGESLLLAGLGGGLGLLGAFWLARLIEGFSLPQYRLGIDAGMDARVLWFGLGASVVTGVVFGLAPALRAGRAELLPELRGVGSAAGTKSRRFSLPSFLVIAQVAMSVVILAGAGLCARSLWKIYAVDPGFEPSHLVLLAPDATLNNKEEPALRAFYDDLLTRVRSLPGIEAASLAGNTPLGGRPGGWSIADVDGHEKQPDERLFADVSTVSSGYFQTLRVPILGGREFSKDDTASSVKTAIVDRTFAQRYLPGQNPIGRRIYMAGPPDVPQPVFEIVGVVGNTHKQSLTESPRPTLFLPATQHRPGNLTLVVRTGMSGDATMPLLKETVRAVDPNVPILRIDTMEQQVAGTVGLQRVVAWLLTGFGGLALLLASLGVYGVLSYSVGRRTREFGVRQALGAGVGEVVALVMRQGLAVVLVGMVAGLAVAGATGRFLRSFLYEIEPLDPLTFALVIVVLGVAAALACFIPARRAANVDPMEALRNE